MEVIEVLIPEEALEDHRGGGFEFLKSGLNFLLVDFPADLRTLGLYPNCGRKRRKILGRPNQQSASCIHPLVRLFRKRRYSARQNSIFFRNCMIFRDCTLIQNGDAAVVEINRSLMQRDNEVAAASMHGAWKIPADPLAFPGFEKKMEFPGHGYSHSIRRLSE